MTNLEGRVLLRRTRRRPAARRAQRPADAGAGWPTRLGQGQLLPGPTRGRSSTSCAGPAPAASPTTPASATSASTRARASSGRARPRTTPAPRGCSPTASPPPTAGPASSRSGHRLAARAARRGLPVPADHRPGSLTQYQSGTQTRRSPTLAAAVPRPYVELHPELARRLGIADGDLVRAGHPRAASAVLDARLDPTASGRTRCSCRSTGAARPCVNALTSDALDPTSRMPEFKTCAVAVDAGRRRARPVPDRPQNGLAAHGRRPHLKPTAPDEETPMHSTPRFLQGIYPFDGPGRGQARPAATPR